MHGILSPSDNMDLDASEVSTQLWSLQPGFNTPSRIKVEVSSSRVYRDSTMIELGKKLLQKSKLGLTEDVKELMSLGAPFTVDWVGTSPLHWAAYFNHIEVTDLLLKAGISRDAKNKVDRTPLHIAAQKGHLQILQLLLQYGADVNCKDMLKMTPLHWAAENGCANCVQTLLDYGADISAVNKFDKSPAMVAVDNNHYNISHIIQAASEIEPAERVAKLNSVQTVKSSKPNRVTSIHNQFATEPVLKTVGRRKKLGLVASKSETLGSEEIPPDISPSIEDNSASNNPMELLQAHGITMIEPDNSTTVSTAVESGHTVMLTEAGKLALTHSKSSQNSTQGQQVPAKIPLAQKILGNGKKVITIRADQLINMTKEKKVIIKQGKPINAHRIFQGKLYSPEEEDLLIEKITAKLAEAKRQAELFRVQLEKKEKEAELYKRQLELIKNSREKSSQRNYNIQ